MDSTRRIIEHDFKADPSELRPNGIDLVIAGATWDSRCRRVLEMNWGDGFDESLLVTYFDQGKTGRTVENAEFLRARLEKVARRSAQSVLIDSSDVNGSWAIAKRSLVETYLRVGRPLSVLVDVNSVPRFISLALLGYGARSGVISEFYASYTAAAHYDPTDASTETKFTHGQWLPISIAPLGTGAPPSSRSHLIVSAGFEGTNTRRLVNALEPDRISLAIPTGVSAENDRTSLRVNSVLADEYLLDADAVITCPVLDIRATIRALQPLASPRLGSGATSTTEYASFLLCGPKTVSLAMAVVSLDTPISQVYYPSPDRHAEMNVTDSLGTLLVGVRL